jgi:hypothetical protein
MVIDVLMTPIVETLELFEKLREMGIDYDLDLGKLKRGLQLSKDGIDHQVETLREGYLILNRWVYDHGDDSKRPTVIALGVIAQRIVELGELSRRIQEVLR